jgi:hypothetical protein
MKVSKQIGIGLLAAAMLSCNSQTPSRPTAAGTPAPAKSASPRDDSGGELATPEIVRSKKVSIGEGGLKTVTVGNDPGRVPRPCRVRCDRAGLLSAVTENSQNGPHPHFYWRFRTIVLTFL